MSDNPLPGTEVVPVTVRGTLDCVNLSDNSCRIIDESQAVTCTFPDNLKPAVKDALGDFVEALGEATPQGTSIPNPVVKEVKLQQIKVLERGLGSGNILKPVTAELLRDLDFFKLGEDREDVGDAVEIVRQLREQSWGGANER